MPTLIWANFVAVTMLAGMVLGQIDQNPIIQTIPSELPNSLESSPSEPIKATACEVLKNPAWFNHRMVKIRAEYVSKFQWAGLKDESCSASIRMDAYHVLDDLGPSDGEMAFTTLADDLTHPERLKWKPIETLPPIALIKDRSYQQLQQYASAKFRWKDGRVCVDCPLYRITATMTGRVDYFETQTVAVRRDAATKPFSHAAGDPNDSLSRFVLRSVSDVAAIPIPRSRYASLTPRNISLEEASDLVHTYLKTIGCARKWCGLESYHDSEYPDFYAFQALHDNPGGSANVGFFEVDPRTGDLWNGVICERFMSPSLLKLQATIRHRIGLADAEYRGTRTRGPNCDAGETPHIAKSK